MKVKNEKKYVEDFTENYIFISCSGSAFHWQANKIKVKQDFKTKIVLDYESSKFCGFF